MGFRQVGLRRWEQAHKTPSVFTKQILTLTMGQGYSKNTSRRQKKDGDFKLDVPAFRVLYLHINQEFLHSTNDNPDSHHYPSIRGNLMWWELLWVSYARELTKIKLIATPTGPEQLWLRSGRPCVRLLKFTKESTASGRSVRMPDKLASDTGQGSGRDLLLPGSIRTNPRSVFFFFFIKYYAS